MKLLSPYDLSQEARAFLPRTCAGVPLSDPNNLWHASIISSFGIMFNKPILKLEQLSEPALWTDLGKSEFFDNVILSGPRNSGTNSTSSMGVLTGFGLSTGQSSDKLPSTYMEAEVHTNLGGLMGMGIGIGSFKLPDS